MMTACRSIVSIIGGRVRFSHLKAITFKQANQKSIPINRNPSRPPLLQSSTTRFLDNCHHPVTGLSFFLQQNSLPLKVFPIEPTHRSLGVEEGFPLKVPTDQDRCLLVNDTDDNSFHGLSLDRKPIPMAAPTQLVASMRSK